MSFQTLIKKEKVLAGFPLQIPESNMFIHSIKLRDWADMGSDVFFRKLNLATLSEAEISKMFGGKIIDPFDFFVFKCMSSDEFQLEICNTFSLFFNEKVLFVPEQQLFLVGDNLDSGIINKDNIDQVQNLIRVMYGLEVVTTKLRDESPDLQRIRKKIQAGRETIARIKGQSEENAPELADLIGSLPFGNCGLNILTVWELTYYQFYDQFKRMRAYEDYETNFQSLVAGGDPKKIKLKYWIQNIQLIDK